MEALKNIRQLRDLDILKNIQVPITDEEFKQVGNGVFYHSFDLNNIVIYSNKRSFTRLNIEMNHLQFKNLNNKTILDVGAWDGFFSLEAVRRGAYVTALDYYSWILDFKKMAQLKTPYNQYDCIKEYKNELLPGQAYIKKARELLHIEDKLKLECALLRDFKSCPFDIVFYLGVLYHTKSPLEELEHLRSLTKEYAIIETLYIKNPEIQFYGEGEICNDLTTMWAMNEIGLAKLLKRAGFRKVEVKYIESNMNRIIVYAYI